MSLAPNDKQMFNACYIESFYVVTDQFTAGQQIEHFINHIRANVEYGTSGIVIIAWMKIN
jgi:hypothetical protein